MKVRTYGTVDWMHVHIEVFFLSSNLYLSERSLSKDFEKFKVISRHMLLFWRGLTISDKSGYVQIALFLLEQKIMQKRFERQKVKPTGRALLFLERPPPCWKVVEFWLLLRDNWTTSCSTSHHKNRQGLTQYRHEEPWTLKLHREKKLGQKIIRILLTTGGVCSSLYSSTAAACMNTSIRKIFYSFLR